MNEMNIVTKQEFLGKEFTIYGTTEEPLFLAKDVAEMIDYAKTKEGFYQVSAMLANVDEDEKLTINILNSEGKAHNQSFVTESGLYEVLMLSRKPITKEFKVGKLLGISSNKVGKIANHLGLKIDGEYGKWYVDKSPYSNKEVNTFRYSQKAIELIRKEIR